MKRIALVIFKTELTRREVKRVRSLSPSVVVAPKALRELLAGIGVEWVALEDLTEAGSIYEATALVEELSLLTFRDGTRITKTYQYRGYELWWIHYNNLFLTSCLPYTQNKTLLEYLRKYEVVYLFEPPHENLYASYLKAYGRTLFVLHSRPSLLPPVGILLQSLITFISIPILALQRHPMMVFTGDKFGAMSDYDSRMKYIYEALRERRVAFFEMIRSLESWKTVLSHAVTRKRPTLYSVAILSFGRFLGSITGGQYRTQKEISQKISTFKGDSETHFKLLLATFYLKNVDADIWAIRIAQWILKIVGVKVAFFTKMSDRNFHFVLGCKLNEIPTVGILHGFASRYYNMYDFLPTYDGDKRLSLDKYGVWSEWWKEYYLTHGKAYHEDQLYVSGPMRPLTQEHTLQKHVEKRGGPIRVLFVSEQLAVPEEVLPYLRALMHTEGIEVYMKFRPYRDGFGVWLDEHHPEILEKIGATRILRGAMQDAIRECDMVIGSHSTAVLEALLAGKPIAFFATQKWGDFFSLKGYHKSSTFYAETTEELLLCVRQGQDIPPQVLSDLAERYFGDPYKNGSAWAVDQLIKLLGR